MHDGGELAPTFSIQANDGAAVNNLEQRLAGTSRFTNVNDAPAIHYGITDGLGGRHRCAGPAAPASASTDPDSHSFTFTESASVSHGVFQTTTDGTHWFDATTFTTADLAASHVRFRP